MSKRVHWNHRFAFILAAAGSAVGLGNIWKFPYITGVHGGGAFVLVYLAIILIVGVPILIAEIYIGQESQKNVVEAFEATHRKGSPWQAAGFMGVIAALFIMFFYSVVGGWVLDYVFKSGMNQFAGHSDDEIKGFLGSLFQSPWRQLFWHFIFMLLCAGIVSAGIRKGIERWNEILMPGLFILLFALLVRACFLPGFGEAISFLFSPDASKLSAEGILVAAGHSFFTLSLGLGAMITYGSYIEKKEKIVPTALMIAGLDTVIALAAGIVVFSVVFTFDLEPGKGPTLMFQTLPMLFTRMAGGYFISLAFFVLVAFAALTSAISLMETCVTYWTETRGMNRQKTTWGVAAIIYLGGITCALSFNVLSDVTIVGLTFFDLFDKITSSILLPLGGAIVSLFYGWVLGPKAVAATVHSRGANVTAFLLLWITRLIAPILVFAVLINGLKDW